MSEVVVDDGIDQVEANAIATVYFLSRISGCGVTGEPESEADYWVAAVYFGYAGVPIEPIFIDKQSGSVTWRDAKTSLARLKGDVELWWF